MSKTILLTISIFFIAALSSQAQIATDTTTSPQTADSTVAVKCLGMKTGCCAAQSKSQDVKGKSKKKKNSESCCSDKANADCCAHSKGGNHSGQACHPGCTMPCCVKKD